MKLTNYNGTKASENAYDIQESINLIRNETIPRLQENYFDLSDEENACLLYTSTSPRDRTRSRMPSSA